MCDILRKWEAQSHKGSLDHKLELYRFVCFLLGRWSPWLLQETCFAPISIVGVGQLPAARRQEDDSVLLELPYVQSEEVMSSKLHRAMNSELSRGLASRLASECTMLNDAKELCMELGLEESYLDPCGDHEQWSGGQRVRMVGEPAAAYAAPVGWVRVGLHVDQAQASAHHVWPTWNISFHGIRKECLRRTVMSRTLLPPGTTDASGVPVKASLMGGARRDRGLCVVQDGDLAQLVPVDQCISRSKDKAMPKGAERLDAVNYLFTSPSIEYASHECHAPPFAWRGRKVQLVLQVRQKPGQFRAARPPHLEPQHEVGMCYQDVVWFTKAVGSTMMTGILFRFIDDQQDQSISTSMQDPLGRVSTPSRHLQEPSGGLPSTSRSLHKHRGSLSSTPSSRHAPAKRVASPSAARRASPPPPPFHP